MCFARFALYLQPKSNENSQTGNQKQCAYDTKRTKKRTSGKDVDQASGAPSYPGLLLCYGSRGREAGIRTHRGWQQRDLGLPDMLRSRGTLEVLDRDLVETPEEKLAMYLRAFSTDVYLTSANAISEDGVIVNIDGNGNRVAAITWGPKKVIFVIGMNKVAQTVEAALSRVRGTASPINAARFDIKTPCQTDGVCHNCNSPESICNYVHFLRNSPRGRHQVVLVGEDLGY